MPITLNTNLQAVAVRLHLSKTLTMRSLYFPPPFNLTAKDLQLCLILGDFNGHKQQWGSSSLNGKSKIIEDFMEKHSLRFFNDGYSTYLHPGHRTFSSIDLGICDPALVLDFAWKVLEDSHGSDRFPMVLTSVDGSSLILQERLSNPVANQIKRPGAPIAFLGSYIFNSFFHNP